MHLKIHIYNFYFKINNLFIKSNVSGDPKDVLATMQYSIVYLEINSQRDLNVLTTQTHRYTRLHCKVMDLLADLILVIISQPIVYQIIRYTLNLYSVSLSVISQWNRERNQWMDTNSIYFLIPWIIYRSDWLFCNTAAQVDTSQKCLHSYPSSLRE